MALDGSRHRAGWDVERENTLPTPAASSAPFCCSSVWATVLTLV